jgi:hypothetical protein
LVDDGEGAKQPDSWRLLTPKLSDWGGRGESPLDFGAGVCGGPVVVVAPPAFMGVCGNGSFENASTDGRRAHSTFIADGVGSVGA